MTSPLPLVEQLRMQTLVIERLARRVEALENIVRCRVETHAEPIHVDITNSPAHQGRPMLAFAEAVAKAFDVSVDDLRGRRRTPDLTAARKEFCKMVEAEKRWSLPQIGRFLGGRDHTSILQLLGRKKPKGKQTTEKVDA